MFVSFCTASCMLKLGSNGLWAIYHLTGNSPWVASAPREHVQRRMHKPLCSLLDEGERRGKFEPFTNTVNAKTWARSLEETTTGTHSCVEVYSRGCTQIGQCQLRWSYLVQPSESSSWRSIFSRTYRVIRPMDPGTRAHDSKVVSGTIQWDVQRPTDGGQVDSELQNIFSVPFESDGPLRL
jgi:hypothetical protein